MEKYTEIFKTVGEKTRLKIVKLLLKSEVPLCVCEIMDCLKENQTNISKHLKILKYAGIVEEKREGKFVMYSLTKSEDRFLLSLLNTINSIPENIFKEEIECLKKRLNLRENGKCVIGIRRK
ncbi:MAG TPA: metalloregulator ArsR/SmtB family transcription factor [bacterium]|nr:metalloregulator ArsR/SmtB family transcription factor [bacterium]HOM26709.1 metalloregulator ArsR/SmtB family transcription factor [bacterium]